MHVFPARLELATFRVQRTVLACQADVITTTLQKQPHTCSALEVTLIKAISQYILFVDFDSSNANSYA